MIFNDRSQKSFTFKKKKLSRFSEWWFPGCQSKNYGMLWKGNGVKTLQAFKKLFKKMYLQHKLVYTFCDLAVPTLITYPPDHTANTGWVSKASAQWGICTQGM